jgi:hypothetical protein
MILILIILRKPPLGDGGVSGGEKSAEGKHILMMQESLKRSAS